MTLKPTLRRRSSGVLLHPTSLPGPHGGDLGPAAREFIDFLADAGQSWWQVLPLCPPDWTGSPYNSQSSFAGSPALINAEILAGEGFLKKSDLGHPKSQVLRAAAEHFDRHAPRRERDDFDSFRAREAAWLEDHALFCSLKDSMAGAAWTEWPEPLRRRDPAALAQARERLSPEIRFQEFCQWIFSRQWEALRRHGAARGVGLIGDLPIYVSHDSVDCWAHQELFALDDAGRPTAVAGVPPDYFSKTGQLWGNPLYRWEVHAREGFSWWLSRLRVCARLFDVVRLDHFIGFRNYWEIPAGEKDAVSGHWVLAPGERLFETVLREIPDLDIIAEDLGVLTPEVEALRERFSFPGMRVGQFAFSGKDAEWPAAWPMNCVGYTGTHDNDTSRGWFDDGGGSNARRPAAQAEKERAAFLRALGGRMPEGPAWAMMRLVWSSPALLAIAPMQDLLNLGTETRMNRPGLSQGNWQWRMDAGALTWSSAGRLGVMTGSSGRAPGALP